MQVALETILYNAFGGNPVHTMTLRDQGCKTIQAKQITFRIQMEWGVRLTTEQVLDWTPHQISTYISSD